MSIFAAVPMESNYLLNYEFIFILALLSAGAFILLLRAKIMFLVQLIFLVTIVLVEPAHIVWVMNVLLVVQLVLTLLVVYRIKKAIDRNYQLVMEKTHAVKRQITKNDYSGGQKSFFR